MNLSSPHHESFAENKESSHEESVLSYYEFADTRNFESLYSLFSNNVAYYRCEQEILGIEQLKRFYEKERKINGNHIINNTIVNKKSVAVRGIFSGTNGNGETIKLNFADFFEFDDSGKINRRFTYLAEGYNMTR